MTIGKERIGFIYVPGRISTMGKITWKPHKKKKKPLREKMKKMSIEGSPDYSRDLRRDQLSSPQGQRFP